MKQKGKLGDWVKITYGYEEGVIGKIVGITKWINKRMQYRIVSERHIKEKDLSWCSEVYWSYQFKVMTKDEMMVEKL